ncbi:uncharacterized protein LOC131213406 [Anopheles bellator]|uniref:uncharacterized protein LOC131213406 n=1 Tax=Anopheles bellator TaxID=139047 RepID=UPI00264A0689|nr:uncharacterized protein LOC131213406 [Anopheles bellator]
MAMTRQLLLGGVGGDRCRRHCPSFSHWVLLGALFAQLATSAPAETGQQPAIPGVNLIHGAPDHLQERERRIIGQRMEALEPHFIGRELAIPVAYLQCIDGDGPSPAEDDLLALALDSFTGPGRPRVVVRVAAGSGMAARAALGQALSPYGSGDVDLSLVLLVSGLAPHQRAMVQQVGLEFPLAAKLVLLGPGGPDPRCPDETELQSVHDLLSALWRTGQVTHLAFAWYQCPAGEAPLVALYDPFAHPGTHDSSRWWGAFRLMKEREPVNGANGGQHLNLNRMPVDILGFDAAMAYRRSDIEMMPRTFPPVRCTGGGSDPSDTEGCGGDSSPYQDTLFGADVDALRELAHRMNFSARVRYEAGNFGFRTANGTFTGVLGGLLARRSWLSMNVYFLKDYETRDLLFSAAVYQDSLCVFVQAAGMLPNWLLIFRCFSPTLWISACGTVVIVTVCYIALSGLVARPSADPDRLPAVLMGQIVSAMLNAPVARLEATTGHQKMYIACGLIWGLTLTGAFQGSLVNVYTTPRSMRNLDTLDELDASGLSITVTAPALIVDVFGTERPGQNTLGNLKARLVIQHDPTAQQVGRAVVAGRTAGLIRNQDFGRLLTKHLIADGTSQVHRLQECPRSYTLAYLYPRGSPLYRVANGHLLRFLQHGLYAKWQSDAAHVLAMNHALKVRQLRARQLAAHLLDQGEGRMALRLDHLLLPFMLLSGGLAIGTVCLLGERYFLPQTGHAMRRDCRALFRIGRHRVRDKRSIVQRTVLPGDRLQHAS